MNLAISAPDIGLTPALRQYVETKLERIQRHFDEAIEVTVNLGADKLVQRAAATLRVRGNDLFAEASDGDLYAAIDALIDKLDRQVAKYKEKRDGFDHDSVKFRAES
ncbi:MAG TPA: ribosome-associated translation inhibitor RaiA [Zeimonas sp.]|nr:ribosome-associated translation inhibitor RaiA [Zeimonas sp.]